MPLPCPIYDCWLVPAQSPKATTNVLMLVQNSSFRQMVIMMYPIYIVTPLFNYYNFHAILVLLGCLTVVLCGAKLACMLRVALGRKSRLSAMGVEGKWRHGSKLWHLLLGLTLRIFRLCSIARPKTSRRVQNWVAVAAILSLPLW